MIIKMKIPCKQEGGDERERERHEEEEMGRC
jgi:hypothetical protein